MLLTRLIRLLIDIANEWLITTLIRLPVCSFFLDVLCAKLKATLSIEQKNTLHVLWALSQIPFRGGALSPPGFCY